MNFKVTQSLTCQYCLFCAFVKISSTQNIPRKISKKQCAYCWTNHTLVLTEGEGLRLLGCVRRCWCFCRWWIRRWHGCTCPCVTTGRRTTLPISPRGTVSKNGCQYSKITLTVFGTIWAVFIVSGNWACEPTLWTWKHTGRQACSVGRITLQQFWFKIIERRRISFGNGIVY